MEPTKLKPQDWKMVFCSSPVIAGAESFNESELPQGHWEFPRDTWFRKQLARVRAQEVERG